MRLMRHRAQRGFYTHPSLLLLSVEIEIKSVTILWGVCVLAWKTFSIRSVRSKVLYMQQHFVLHLSVRIFKEEILFFIWASNLYNIKTLRKCKYLSLKRAAILAYCFFNNSVWIIKVLQRLSLTSNVLMQFYHMY